MLRPEAVRPQAVRPCDPRPCNRVSCNGRPGTLLITVLLGIVPNLLKSTFAPLALTATKKHERPPLSQGHRVAKKAGHVIIDHLAPIHHAAQLKI